MKHNECLQIFRHIFKNILIKWGSYIILLNVVKTFVFPFKMTVFSNLLELSLMKFRCEMSGVCPLQMTSFGITGLSAVLQLAVTALHCSCTSLAFSWCSGIMTVKGRKQVFSFAELSLFNSVTLHSYTWISFLKNKGHFKRELQHVVHGQETTSSYNGFSFF